MATTALQINFKLLLYIHRAILGSLSRHDCLGADPNYREGCVCSSTSVTIADWPRGEHLTQTGPIRVFELRTWNLSQSSRTAPAIYHQVLRKARRRRESRRSSRRRRKKKTDYREKSGMQIFIHSVNIY